MVSGNVGSGTVSATSCKAMSKIKLAISICLFPETRGDRIEKVSGCNIYIYIHNTI